MALKRCHNLPELFFFHQSFSFAIFIFVSSGMEPKKKRKPFLIFSKKAKEPPQAFPLVFSSNETQKAYLPPKQQSVNALTSKCVVTASAGPKRTTTTPTTKGTGPFQAHTPILLVTQRKSTRTRFVLSAPVLQLWWGRVAREFFRN